MTAVDVDALAKLAAVLDDTATGLWMAQHGPGWGRVVAAALLPVVDRIANERAAAELEAAAAWAREAADNWGGDRTSDARKNVAHGGYVISNEIASRAAALREPTS